MSDIQAGDTILHKPTREHWFILGVNKQENRVCAAGYPPTEARLNDCVLSRKGDGITEYDKEYRDIKFGTNWDE